MILVRLLFSLALFLEPRALAGPGPVDGEIFDSGASAEGALESVSLVSPSMGSSSAGEIPVLAQLLQNPNLSLRGIPAFSLEARAKLAEAQHLAAEQEALSAPAHVEQPSPLVQAHQALAQISGRKLVFGRDILVQQPRTGDNGAPHDLPKDFEDQPLPFEPDPKPAEDVETEVGQSRREYDGSGRGSDAVVADWVMEAAAKKAAEQPMPSMLHPRHKDAYKAQRPLLLEFDVMEAAGLPTIEIDDKSLSLLWESLKEVTAAEIYDARNLVRLLRPYSIFVTKQTVVKGILNYLRTRLPSVEYEDFLRTRRLISIEEFGTLHNDLNISLSEELMREDNMKVREKIVAAVAELREVAAQEYGMRPEQVPVKIAPFIAGPKEWELSADLNARGIRNTVDGPLDFDFFENKSLHRLIFETVREEHPELNFEIAPGYSDIYTEAELARKGALLWDQNPDLKALFIRLNKGTSGLGNMKLRLLGSKNMTLEARERYILRTIRRLKQSKKMSEFFDILKNKKTGGAVVEAFLGWVPRSPAPSIQLRIFADGTIMVRTAHDQVLYKGVFMGGTHPADPAYNDPLVAIGLEVGKLLYEMGYIGAVGIDTAANMDGEPVVYGIEINPRETGLFHPAEAVMQITGARPDGKGGLVLPDGRQVYYESTDHAMIPSLVGLKGLFSGEEQEDEGFLAAMTLPDSLLHLILGVPRKGNMGATFWSFGSLEAARRGLQDFINRAKRFGLARTQRRSEGPPLAESPVQRDNSRDPAIVILASDRVERLALLEVANRLFPGKGVSDKFVLVTDEKGLTADRKFLYRGYYYDARKDQIVEGVWEHRPAYVFDFTRKTRDRLKIRARSLREGVKVPKILAFTGPGYSSPWGSQVSARTQRRLESTIGLVPFPDVQGSSQESQAIRKAVLEWVAGNRPEIGEKIVVHTQLDEFPQVFTTPGTISKAGKTPTSDELREQVAEIADYIMELREKVGNKGAVVVESARDSLFLKIKAVHVPGSGGVDYSFDKKVYRSYRDENTYELRAREENWEYWLNFYGMQAGDDRYNRFKEDIKATVRRVFAANPNEYTLDLYIGIEKSATDALIPVLVNAQAENDPPMAELLDEFRGDLKALRAAALNAQLRRGQPMLETMAKAMAELVDREQLRNVMKGLSRWSKTTPR